jgi:4-amino-4-deoxy-L-arabinose transferase-like glycosyltransferase
LRNLSLARSAILPFFAITAVVVFLWTRREFGDFAGLAAAVLFTTLPIVLAFSGMAYTDVPTACLQFAAFFAFANWLEKPSLRSTLLLGVTLGFALLSKMTTLLFFPATAAGIFLSRWIVAGRNEITSKAGIRYAAKPGMAFLVGAVVLWGGYGFSVGHVRESMQLSPDAMPSFQHFPAPMRSIARNMVLRDSLVPAPALLKGFATIWALNKEAPQAYLLGNIKKGGWWYFFLLGIAVKSPLSLLVLCIISLIPLFEFARQKKWTALAPAACALAILIVTMPVRYDAGVRHVLVVFPLFAIMGGCGASYLWQAPGKARFWGRLVLAGLLLWQTISSLSAGTDFVSYSNELAGRDPSRVLVTGCDLDCGQDLFRLSQTLRDRGVSHFSVAVWSSADMTQMNLPMFDVLQPFQPTPGWIAISMRSMRFGDVFHSTYPLGALRWIDRYQPVALVGKTIRLYYVPEK